ncbi:urea carboxylase [Hoyosella rhizosphaerae]|uniref:biotin carboxylase n=1 Tax=Hoyosella rhizosphaerae TaxID=1755582 RepID=A0A916U3A5_9ACTN|nr:urea carboxylase [Hoyosella rhizosphaerae]MBN4926605.1 urea carboxylase [Hoyosella rhizosphaerae]GGC57957.1 urea carboxylase [Hoyosella rhizosphaerae]
MKTLLIANRGEIACRIIRTAREMGIRTVAVFSDADRGSAHVRQADEAIHIGPTPPRESYLNVEAILAAARKSGADAIHPGYGFLSEDADFAERVEAEGMAFVGPTPQQLRIFGTKHTARDAAHAAGVPMIAGTGLVSSPEEVIAAGIGYPLMLKATGGGGGIGMQVCWNDAELIDAYETVARLASQSFSATGVFAERYVQNARHIEVQIFGDGNGRVITLGDRDCSLQRRNQKVVEEAPAPTLPDDLRKQLHDTSRALAESVNYRSAGTVEFVYDAERQEASFLEVNSRLQVEHPVTEEVTGVDLVRLMLELARGDGMGDYPDAVPVTGHAIEARVYAEDPTRNFLPSAGRLTQVVLPQGARVDTWVETGTEVSTAYDPMLAKIIVSSPTRAETFSKLRAALVDTRVDGIETNLGLLRAITGVPTVLAAEHSTATLADVADEEPRIVVERPGMQTTVQDYPGRTGLWQVGVPPSGPMDDLSFRLGNKALGNQEGAPGLECTVGGPALRFTHATTVCVTGADSTVAVNGVEVPMWQPVAVPAGGVLDVGTADDAGLRTYILFDGGLDIPEYLGSASTFTLGQFGGHGGRALRSGDVLRALQPESPEVDGEPISERPEFTHQWELAVTEGPHGAPEFFTRADMEALYGTPYEVHFNSARTGVRLVGPRPQWARTDGGEAGLHPSNIHDNAYSIGSLDFTGDTPILLGPDGPSLGGFVCPVTVVAGQRWKLGQLRPGDTVRFVPVRSDSAATAKPLNSTRWIMPPTGGDGDDGVLLHQPDRGDLPSLTYRRTGNDNVLVEYGDITLDLELRARIHALHAKVESAAIDGIVDLTPGIRSLQVHVDPDVLPVATLVELLQQFEEDIPAASELVVPSRTVRLPLSWDDPATREAIERYMSGVRSDAPWCPWNIEFIRRINGLDTVDQVFETVFDAEYLVLGLGDVYLGAPVATPLDPRHRLVTTKYNPARTWTPENAVGIGGAYMCVYGMEGPGGYQFVGRTTQIWQRHAETPWLLRFFDRISWYPVSPDELLEMRADMAAGRFEPDITDGEFSLAEYREFLAANADPIADFRAQQHAAFGAERAAWEASGEFDRQDAEPAAPPTDAIAVPDGGTLVEAPFVANVWKVSVTAGDTVSKGDVLLALEAMKMETVITAPKDGVIDQVVIGAGTQVLAGDALVVMR